LRSERLQRAQKKLSGAICGSISLERSDKNHRQRREADHAPSGVHQEQITVAGAEGL